jgi:hypothetical protein
MVAIYSNTKCKLEKHKSLIVALYAIIFFVKNTYIIYSKDGCLNSNFYKIRQHLIIKKIKMDYNGINLVIIVEV